MMTASRADAVFFHVPSPPKWPFLCAAYSGGTPHDACACLDDLRSFQELTHFHQQ
jgi:hypothetical protein